MPMDPVTLPNAAGIPPHVAQVPIAMTARAPPHRLHVGCAGLELDGRVMEEDEWDGRERTGQQALDGRGGGSQDGDRAAVAAHPGEPEDVHPVERSDLRPRPAPGRDDGRPAPLADARDVAALRDRLPGWGDPHWMPPLGGQPALGAADPARAAIESASAAIATPAGLVGSWSPRGRARPAASGGR